MRITEYPPYILHPRHLSKEETEHPCLVFYHMFSCSHLPQLREHLWEWLKITVSGTYSPQQYEPEERENILLLYEHMQKLLEAAHILYLQQKEELKKILYQDIETSND